MRMRYPLFGPHLVCVVSVGHNTDDEKQRKR